jgi:hypothetical protein
MVRRFYGMRDGYPQRNLIGMPTMPEFWLRQRESAQIRAPQPLIRGLAGLAKDKFLGQ